MSITHGDDLRPRSPGMRVLVVDDSLLIREVVRIALEHDAGWQVVTADSGTAALDVARTARPDVILLDVVMPGLDGPQTLARLREDPQTRAIPVIFATAKNRSEELAALVRLGADGAIAKPFDADRLADQVVDTLARAG